MGMEIKSILNVLTLLKQEPKNIEQLWKSDCFYSWSDLRKTLQTCINAGLVRTEYFGREKLDLKEVMSQKSNFTRWHKKIYCFYLTDLGLTFLSFYRNWEVKQVIHPSWKKKDLWTRAPVEY